MKSKILFILHMPPPVHGAAMVGQYIHDSEVVNGQFECHYINLATAKDLQDIGKVNLKKFSTFFALLRRIRRAVRTVRPDLVYITPNAAGGAFYKDFVIVQMVKAMGCRVVVHYHNKGVSTRQSRVFDNLLYRRFFRRLKVILLAKELYADISKYVSEEDVFICPNGIPASKVQVDDKERDGATFRFLYLSNMIATKGVPTLLEACRLLKERDVRFSCTFVGGWKDITEESFTAMVDKAHLIDCVRAVGPVYGEAKESYWATADAFVFPTYYPCECFPLVLLEAMEHGLPCVSTTEGGIPSIIDDRETGFIVPPRDPVSLADRMQWLVSHQDEARQMGEKGLEKFRSELTIGTFEQNFCKILTTILE